MYVMINLPASDALYAFFGCPDKAAHIIRRISQKQSDLMRKGFVSGQALPELRKILYRRQSDSVSVLLQDLQSLGMSEVALKTVRSVNVYQRPSVKNLNRHNVNPLAAKNAI